MSYGDYVVGVQGSLIWLLNHDAPQADDVEAMLRYRYDIAVSTVEVLAAAMPIPRPGVNSRRLSPWEVPSVELARRLNETVTGIGGLPSLVSLAGAADRSEHLRVWHAASTAAVIAERELQAVLCSASPEQRWAAVKDAADTIRGLCVLDDRYQSLDGWVPLPNRNELGVTAVAASALAAEGNIDYSIDAMRLPQRHRRPVSAPGVTGAAQAQQNLAIDLQRPPPARPLRQVLLAQFRLSATAAEMAAATSNPTRQQWNARTVAFRELLVASRDVDGLVGARPFAVESAVRAATLLTNAANEPGPLDGNLQALARATGYVDLAIRAAIERGLNEGLYLVPTGDKQLTRGAGGIVKAEHTWRPADPEDPVPLRDVARDKLHAQAASAAPRGRLVDARRAQRAAFQTQLAQPSLRPTGPGVHR